MTIEQAVEAVDLADEAIRGVEDIDEMGELSNWDNTCSECPPHFTHEQKQLVHHIFLREYLRSIGRA